MKLTSLSDNITWKHIFGTGILGGIGFTMSIFITLLAFKDESIVDHAKISVMIASLTSGIIGFLFLRSALRKSLIHELKNPDPTGG